MEPDNIYDLDDFSNEKENGEKEVEEKKEIFPNNNIDNDSPKDLSLMKSFSEEKPKLFGNNQLFDINGYKCSNDSYDPKYQNLSLDNKNNISEIQINPFSSKFKEKPEKKFSNAIEDNIDISEFDKIENPAMKFEFILDNFQKRSIIRLEQEKNILVCAHTSSGKTLVAEYGIALGKRKNKKVIYTSPIKALSNQKYCDFKKKFKDVGIITGDVNINPNAQCLIITTEILHKFLYNQSSILNNVGTVIFDEIHYINDLERGHIWEEILIVLPSNISIIMLSATIPNYCEFANWVGKIKNTIVYVEVTKNRVVPLKYFMYINSDNVVLVKDKDEINETNFNEALKLVKDIHSSKKKNCENNNNIENNSNEIVQKKLNAINKSNEKEKRNKNKEVENNSNDEKEELENNDINDEENNNEEEENIKETDEKQQRKLKILIENVHYIINNKLYPATLFIFNIRKISEYSSLLLEKGNLNELPSSEKSRINNFFEKVINTIPKQEQNIKQIKYIKNLLQYGIGVHHSGLLPILKEIIEILYLKGLIKILIATTSFSIGLNMPTRTVIFISLYKYHDNKRQILSSSEFLQMSGRAGRRGKDLSGNVYIICCGPLGKSQIKKIKELLKGEGNELESKFRLSYRIILSFYHRNVKNIKDFFKESFHENHNSETKPGKEEEIKRIEESIKKEKRIECKIINKYFDIEDSPIYNLIGIINKIDIINKRLYNHEKIIEYLKAHPSTILQVKTNNNTTINKFHSPDIVMLVKFVEKKDRKKLWCITLTSYDDKQKEEDTKNNESNNPKVFSDKGQIQEFRYKYLVINLCDIIEIYELPKIDKIDKFYQNENIINYFNVDYRGFYYFKNDKKSLYIALQHFYRVIINNFPRKTSILKNKNPRNSDNIENNKVKALDYKKIIGEKNIKKDISKLRELKLQLKKNNPCENCPYYNVHLNLSKNIYDKKCQIDDINKRIKEGEEDEIQKKFNNRICLLKALQYILEDKDDIINNSEYSKLDNFSLTIKGKASLEIITNDNILITELLSSHIFYNNNNELISSQVIIPFLSIFVGNAKTKDLNYKIILENEKYNEEAKMLFNKFYSIYNELTKKEGKLELKESVYNRSFSCEYFESVYSWILGNSFCDVCDKYKIIEGKLYHIIIRTFYLAEEIVNFYSKLGNEKLVNVFKDIKETLLKGIMSVESLYIQENIDINNI